MKEKKQLFIKRIWNYFTTYEKIWYLTAISAMIFLLIFLFDEVISAEGDESFVGNNLFAICTIIAIFANLTCELLISKQSYWNFIVSVCFIELFECVIYFTMHDYATALISLCFWVPIDIISFIVWIKKKDDTQNELTKVRKLTPLQDVFLGIGVIIFTTIVGYLLTLIGGEETYVDACVAGLGIINGLLILFRFREQWIVWIIYLLAEGVLIILNGQFIMLIKTVALLINSTYGFIMWTKYIKTHKENKKIEIQTQVEQN